MNTKQKGDLLESVVSKLCSGIKNAKVTKDAKITGQKSKSERQIDVLIEGKVGAITVKIVVEAKNYAEPVGIEKIEALKAKLDDVGANMGAMDVDIPRDRKSEFEPALVKKHQTMIGDLEYTPLEKAEDIGKVYRDIIAKFDVKRLEGAENYPFAFYDSRTEIRKEQVAAR